MELQVISKNKEEKVNVLVQKIKGDLIIGTIKNKLFSDQLKKELLEFEKCVNTQQFSLLDQFANKLNAYKWGISKQKWIVSDFQIFNKKDISFRITNLNFLNQKEIYTKLEKLAYDTRWIIYKYLTIEELNNQYLLFSKAVADPKSTEAEKGYQHTEHLRFQQFNKIAKEYNEFTNQQLEEIMELVETDSDKIMAENFYHNIVSNKKVTAKQIEKYIDLQNI